MNDPNTKITVTSISTEDKELFLRVVSSPEAEKFAMSLSCVQNDCREPLIAAMISFLEVEYGFDIARMDRFLDVSRGAEAGAFGHVPHLAEKIRA